MLVESFIKYIRYELNRSAHTVLSYRGDITQFIEYCTNGVNEEFKPELVTSADVRGWMVQLSKSGVGSRSIRRKVQSLRALYRYLIKQGMVVEDPTMDIEMAKVKRVLPSYVKPDVMDVVLGVVFDKSDFESVRDNLMLLMLYTTGMRRAELISLLDKDVDTTVKELKVMGKRSKSRIIPFGDELSDAISQYREVKDMVIGGDTERFFTRISGEPLYPSLVYNVVHSKLAAVDAASKMSPHVLRHSFASSLLNNGAELNSVKELLGHQSLVATQVYTHVTFSELKENYKQAHPRATKKGGYYGSKD
ncbi:MAG: tyrosine-type recombinase/integrase [Bacteroidales bacterium]